MANQKSRGNSDHGKTSGRSFKSGKVLKKRQWQENAARETMRASAPNATYARER